MSVSLASPHANGAAETLKPRRPMTVPDFQAAKARGVRLTMLTALLFLVWLVERRSLGVAVTFAVALAGGSFYLFDTLLRVPLPRYRMPDVVKLSAGYYAATEMDLVDLFVGA